MSAGSIDTWGPSLWRFLHATSFSFQPTDVSRRQMLQFLRSLGPVLPCSKCREHYQVYIDARLDERVVQDVNTLSRWVVDLHNSVNKKTGKQEYTLDEARRLFDVSWLGGTASTCPTKGTAHSNASPQLNTVACVVVSVVFSLLVALSFEKLKSLPNRWSAALNVD